MPFDVIGPVSGQGSMVAPRPPETAHVRPESSPPSQRLRRRRRILGAFPIALASWAVIAGLPISPAKPSTGTLHTEEIKLTGPDADPAVRVAGTTRARNASPTGSAGPGWTARVPVAEPSQAVAVSWTGAPAGEVEIRGLSEAGWSEWLHIHGEPDDSPDQQSSELADIAGGLVWFGGDGVTEVEVVVEDGTLSGLKVEAMRYQEPPGGSLLTALQAPAAGAADTQPTILPRSNWTSKGWATQNEDCVKGPIAAEGGVKFAVVHHTVNSNTYSQSDVPAMLASIYQFHTGTRGWCDIAYNFIIDRFGRTWEARTGSIKGAIVGGHASGFNTNSVGVSFLGQHQPGESNYAAVAPTNAQLVAAGNVIGWKLGQSDNPASGTVTVKSGSGTASARFPEGTSATIARVSSHRDVGYSSCPGELLYKQLSVIRTTAATVASNTTPTIPPPTTTSTTSSPTGPTVPSKPLGPFETVVELVDNSYTDVLRRSPSADERNLASAAITGGQKAEVFLANLVGGVEADTQVKQVIRLYRAYFLRNPDHNGLEYWIQRRKSGWDLSRISTEFAHADEFVERYGALNSGQFIDLVYENVLDRAPDQAGRAYWLARLSDGRSRGAMMIGFSESPEYRAKTDAGVTVVALYDAMLRSGIPQGTYDYLEERLRAGITDASGVARYFLDNAKYHARFK